MRGFGPPAQRPSFSAVHKGGGRGTPHGGRPWRRPCLLPSCSQDPAGVSDARVLVS